MCLIPSREIAYKLASPPPPLSPLLLVPSYKVEHSASHESVSSQSRIKSDRNVTDVLASLHKVREPIQSLLSNSIPTEARLTFH